MNDTLFERLLYEEEGTTLDFKRDQYRFSKASEEDKSELLKDILGFANAWRRSEAYILIGVQDVRGGRGEVIGISSNDHLDDHSLQQFVNNLTYRPVRFHYEAFGFEGKQVGIICVEEQQARPLYLKSHYGKLKKTEVYIRRGSSTDPTKPAGPDEIAMMGQGSGPQNAELMVEFAYVEKDDSLGTQIILNAEFCKMPPLESIPDLARERTPHSFGIDLASFDIDPRNRLNEDFFRDLAEYEFVMRLFRPVRLVVKNVGRVIANSVRAELTIPTNIGVVLLDCYDLPTTPKRHISFLDSPALRNIRPAFRREPGEVNIEKNAEQFRLEIDFGSLQPGRRVLSDVFHIGKIEIGEFSLSGQLLAGNLAQPKDFTLLVSVNLTITEMTVAELCSLPDPVDEDD